MKTSKLVFLGIFLFLTALVHAQVSVNVKVGSPPPWGPIGYTEVRYYYIPDIESYYDIESSMFIYYSSGIWVHRTYLPVRYKNYDLYSGYKVVMTDYHGNTPYVHFSNHKKQYYKGYRGQPQKNIGQKPNRTNSATTNYSKEIPNKKASSNNRNGNSNQNGHSNGSKGKRK